tara:strand:- start:423 stop:731 length:309 start_codon:yes stop_codon:yes gene_type:complete
MLVTLTEVVTSNANHYGSSVATQSFTLREITVNPQHVICLREDSSMVTKLNEGSLPEGLDGRQRFTKVILDRGHSGLELTVVGEPRIVSEKLRISARELLRG